MRYLLLTLIIFTGLTFGAGELDAITGEDVRWDWTLGEPAITNDPTSVCDDTAVARADWVLGEPAVVFDATANCTGAPAPSTPSADTGLIWFW